MTALPRLFADWNMNRYIGTTVTNTPSEDTDGNDIEMFPIESIVQSPRPVKGISKARINQSIVSDDYGHPSMPRFYVASVDDKYKYWQSPYTSDNSGNISGVQPTIIYDQTVEVNKVVIKLENSWASPTALTIEYTTNGGSSWQTISSAPTIRNDGQIILYFNGAGWSSTRPDSLSPLVAMNGIRMTVTQLGPGKTLNGTTTGYRVGGVFNVPTTGKNSYFSLIEMGVHREVELTDRVISVSDTFDAGEASQITPVGTITSNVANLELWNADELFSPENEGSIYAKFIEANVEMNMQYIYTVNGTKYPVQQFRMFTDEWAPTGEGTVQVSLSDASKYLKEVKPLPGLYEGLTLAQIIYRLCDSVGFSDYNIITNVNSTDYEIPIFYVDGEATIWEIFDDLATATQSLIYFDAFGKLNVKTREDAFNKDRSIDWTLRGETSGSELADIISLNQSGSYEANVVKVTYKSTKWSDFQNGIPALTPVWEPEGTVVLRASPLAADVPDANWPRFKIDPKDVELWPYTGLVQIQGEIIKYEGKYFSYRDGSGNTVTAVVKDADEYEKLNKLADPTKRYMNHFTGEFAITERGAWNSMARAHSIDVSGYSLRQVNFGTGIGIGGGSMSGFRHNRTQSTVTLSGAGRLSSNKEYLIATRGASNDTGWRHLGMRFRFNKGSYDDQRGGIVFNNSGANESGYYVEFTATKALTEAARAWSNETRVYTRNSGTSTTITNQENNGRGAKTRFVEGTWYEADIYYNWNTQAVSVWINGKKCVTATIPNPNQISPNGKFGMYVRGNTSMEVEYLYAIARNEPEPLDDTSFLNRITGAYEGKQWDREWTYKYKTIRRRVKKKWVKEQVKWNQQFIDEFGPIVHEVREYEVKFDPAPVKHSKLYYTNDWSAIATEYRADAFSARFVVANAARENAVMNGDDSLSIGGSTPIEQHLLVYGRALVVGEQEEVEARNDAQVKARGEIETEVSSDWIQSKAAAKALAKWIESHWGTGMDELSVEVFGNPLFELGDLVAVEYARKSMTTANNQYFVVGINTAFDSGVTTTLTLRRKV